MTGFQSMVLGRIATERIRPIGRFRARLILQDADFAEAIEKKVRRELELPVGEIDWSEIDWVEVMKLVLMILAAFGVL